MMFLVVFHLLICTWVFSLSTLLVNAKSGQETLLGLCSKWDSLSGTCPLQRNPNSIQNFYIIGQETLCKADISVVANQIDWKDPDEGKGSVSSITINNKQLLTNPVYPSDAYFAPQYPKCDHWFGCLSPHSNVIPGTEIRKSILNFAETNTLNFDLLLTWNGSHNSKPLCAMNGVFYAAIVRIDLYYEAQENNLCPGWNPKTNSVCSGHGTCSCSPSDGQIRSCICSPGYIPPTCNFCDNNHYGSSCEFQCSTCFNGGQCVSGLIGDGACICRNGFDNNTRCATCLPNHYGPNCDPCVNCHFTNGNCIDGINGNGECVCGVGYDLLQGCTNCLNNFYGPICKPCDTCGSGHCKDGINGDGTCVCPQGFDILSRCIQCLPDHYGSNCTRCKSCNGHGVCNDLITGDGNCICEDGYTKESRCFRCQVGWEYNRSNRRCECAPEHFGFNCLSCPICAPHGKCNAGPDGDGSCICDIGWSDSNNCVGCMEGYYGFNCQPCRNCFQGRCDDGLRGTGQCLCKHGWDPATICYDCIEGFFGPTCEKCLQDCGNGKCFNGINGTGECLCDEGWELNSTRPCTQCKAGYYGSDCKPCPGLAVDGVPCNGHGTCIEMNNAAICVCNTRYNGESCQKYDFPILTIGLLAVIAMTTLGFCLCSMRRLNHQEKHNRYGYGKYNLDKADYVEISELSDLKLFISSDSKDWLIPFESLTLQFEVGNGTSGQVFRSLYHSGGGTSIVAVKRLYSPMTGQEYFQNFFKREVSILSKLHHPNVVRFYGVSYYSRVLYIVTDFCPISLGDLIDEPNAKGPFEASFFLKIATQITSGMAFLHSRNVVHRDLKPANVLLAENEDVNICDFGLSRLLDPEMTSMTAEVGTPSYMAPEMATMGGTQCSTKGDVYSFGILLYSMWTRRKPYGDQGMNPFQLMTAVINGLRPVIPINCPPGLAELIRACWDANPDCRPSFPEVSLQLKDESIAAMSDSINAKLKDINCQPHTQAQARRKKNEIPYSESKSPPYYTGNVSNQSNSSSTYGTIVLAGSASTVNLRRNKIDTLLTSENDGAMTS